jgi:hypothetical protein
MRRVTLAGCLLAAATALPIAADAHHNPGHQGGPAALSIAAQPNPVVFGRNVTVSGRLTGPNNSGKTVNLQSDRFPFEGNFQNAGNATTNAQGAYSFTRTPPVHTRYRTRQGPNASTVVTVLVRIRVSLRLSDATPEAGQLVRFSGRACPQHDGAEVRIQRRTATGKWRTVRKTVLRDIPNSGCSRYRKRFRVFRDRTYRAVVVRHNDHSTGFSARRRQGLALQRRTRPLR